MKPQKMKVAATTARGDEASEKYGGKTKQHGTKAVGAMKWLRDACHMMEAILQGKHTSGDDRLGEIRQATIRQQGGATRYTQPEKLFSLKYVPLSHNTARARSFLIFLFFGIFSVIFKIRRIVYFNFFVFIFFHIFFSFLYALRATHTNTYSQGKRN